MLDIKAEVEAAPEPVTSLPEERLAHYEAEYDKLIADGLAAHPSPDVPPPKKHRQRKQSPPKNLLAGQPHDGRPRKDNIEIVSSRQVFT